MITTNIAAIMCANMLVQNTLRIQRNKREEEKEARKVQATFQSTLNKEKQKQKE